MFNVTPKFTPPRLGRTKYIHFIGIGGAGMCGIAEVLHNLGYEVTGSDQKESDNTRHLRQLKISIFIGHRAENIQHADVVVTSTIIPPSNIEVVSAKARAIPIIRRAEMLAELMRLQHGIAIAGTHGKTTTTSLVASLLSEGGLDPTYVIGGKLTSSGVNARLGTSSYFIAEADESDASFLYLQPVVAVITNIDADHMETYQDDFNKLCQAFLDFIQHLPFYGLAILCSDDPVITDLLPKISRPMVTYGFNENAHYRAVDFKQVGTQCYFRVVRPEPFSALEVSLNMPGRHNVQNALAAIIVATEHGVNDTAIVHGLAQFAGVGRRLQQHGQFHLPQGTITLIDDYGHHPRELSATFAAVRAAWPTSRLVTVFQPHRYSRTQALFSDFSSVLTQPDMLFLMDIYPADETPISGVNSQQLLAAIQSKGHKAAALIQDPQNLALEILSNLQDGDILLMQGAGDIVNHCLKLIEHLQGQTRE